MSVWVSGKITVEEAISSITKLAVREVLENSDKDGNVHITIENDGSYWFHEK